MTKLYYLLPIFLLTLVCCGQQTNKIENTAKRSILGRENWEKELRLTLSDSTLHNVVEPNKILIKDSLTAIAIAEPILFSVYGKDQIISERPYECYLIDNYWLISGTLPEDYKGGPFMIIIDATNGQIIRITHWK